MPTPDVLPIVPLRDVVLFPYTITSLTLDDPQSIALIEAAMHADRLVATFPCLSQTSDRLRRQDFAPVGCAGRIIKSLRLPDDSVRVLIRGIRRVELKRIHKRKPYMTGRVAPAAVPEDSSVETEAIAAAALNQFQGLVALAPHFPEELKIVVYNLEDYGRLADLVADTINLSFQEKVAVLCAVALRHRLELVLQYLAREEVLLRVGNEIQNKVSAEFARGQRDHFLREQLKAIQEQLGEEPETPDITVLRERLEAAELSEPAREAAQQELGRLRQMHPSSAEYNVSRTYVDWLLALPWKTFSEDQLDIRAAHQILDHDHYDLVKVKDRILEFLAVLQIKQDMKAPILCFVGPPGVGKTSLGQSIARALGRQFVRVSLGGVRDEAEIRGHRRTYVGALPGRIVQSLKRTKTANPVFMLDEIDKLGNDFRGDPASALLEVLDPQQNIAFVDHYLDVPMDLSTILFITTANLADPIPPALRDRMEIIRIPGYTGREKSEIARRFLVPRQLVANGLTRQQLSFHKSALTAIIESYTSEAGVRNLEREIASVARKHARRVVEGAVSTAARTAITGKSVADYLGPQRLFPETASAAARVGVSTGLAWTAAGGEIIQIEASTIPGTGKLILTGSLGDVMKESAQIALSYVRNRHEALGFDPGPLMSLDIHIHVPAGATPKDGPSAGLAIAAAIASLLSGRALKPLLAMTGELSLQGRILPVGGIKEKVLAAVRAGVKTVFLPAKNANDLIEDIPAEVTRKLTVECVDDADGALEQILMPLSEWPPASPAQRITLSTRPSA